MASVVLVPRAANSAFAVEADGMFGGVGAGAGRGEAEAMETKEAARTARKEVFILNVVVETG